MLSRFKSSDNLNNGYHQTSSSQFNNSSSTSRQHCHQHHHHHRSNSARIGQRIFLGRFGRAGSLTNLPYEIAPTPKTSNYFSTRHADRTSTLAESYLGLNEYLSTPYYQYQCKNRAKKDFSNSTYEDMIELGISIPIRMEPSKVTPMHRNEKHILITNEERPDYIESSTIK